MNGNKALQVPFDQYQRYKKTSEIIEQHREEKEIFKILEIGANAHKNLNLFLPNDSISYLDIELPENLLNDPQYILGDATNMIFFKDQEFDVVIALDVFEHIPQELRENFLKEMNRVSRVLFILAGPFDTDGVHEAEVEVNNFYKEKYGEDYIWLKEHIFNELPSLKDTKMFLESKGSKNISNYAHGSLDLWKKIFLSHFEVADNIFLQNLRQQLIDSFYNEYIYEFDISANNYRQFIIGSKSNAILCDSLFLSNMDYIDKKLIEELLIRIQEIFILSQSNTQMHSIQLFLDHGNGISEETSIKLPVTYSNEIQEFVFDLSEQKSLHAIRIDPLNDSCVVAIEKVTLLTQTDEVERQDYISSNACITKENIYYFDHDDPQLYFHTLTSDDYATAKELRVSLRYLYIGKDAFNECYKITKEELACTKEELACTINSISWKITKPLRNFSKLFKK